MKNFPTSSRWVTEACDPTLCNPNVQINRCPFLFYSCLSDQVPPLFGKRSDICFGIRSEEQKRPFKVDPSTTYLTTPKPEPPKPEPKSNVSAYVTIAILVTMFVTILGTISNKMLININNFWSQAFKSMNLKFFTKKKILK